MFGTQYLWILVLALSVCGGLCGVRQCQQEEIKLQDGGVYSEYSGSIQPYQPTAVFKIDCNSVWHVIANACDEDHPEIAISPDLKQIHIRRTFGSPSIAVYKIKYGCAPY